MSQNCNCGCGNTIKVPVRGFELNLDAAAFPATGGGRVKVTEDLHIYIDGKRAEAGDGLTPETAVTNVAEAWKALARYDGDNTYEAYVHFADLEGDERYPDFEVLPGNYTTFVRLNFEGESYLTTKIGQINLEHGTHACFDQLQVRSIYVLNGSHGFIHGSVGFSDTPSFGLRVITNSNFTFSGAIYIYGKSYSSCIAFISAVSCSNVFCSGVINIIEPVSYTHGFMYIVSCSQLSVANMITNGASNITGRKYYCNYMGHVVTNVTLPGSLAGTAILDGKYYSR